MPFLSIPRVLFALLSWLVLFAALYLLWSGYAGTASVTADGVVIRDREPWRLWTGGALLAWSVLGRLPVVWLTTRPGGRPTRAVRGSGRTVDGAAGSTLYVEQEGEGRTLLLVHGWGLDSTIWRGLKAELRGRFRLVTWDLPGLGLSRLPKRGRPSLDLFAEELRGLVVSQGEPVVLIGHSIGGMTIQTLAREHPDMFGREIAGVILLNTTYTDPSRTMVLGGVVRMLRPLVKAGLALTAALQPLAWLSAWQSYLSGSAHLANRLGFGAEATRDQLGHVTWLATRNPPGVQALGIRAMMDWDADGALAGANCPVRVIGGEIDLVTRIEASEHIAATAPRADLLRVPGANHMGFLEQSDVYLSEITRFCASLPWPEPPSARPFARSAAGGWGSADTRRGATVSEPGDATSPSPFRSTGD